MNRSHCSFLRNKEYIYQAIAQIILSSTDRFLFSFYSGLTEKLGATEV
ncbi:MAG: hypothetical protein AB4372_23450 [Xenococcus sp. (in: cyanobacteria)]